MDEEEEQQGASLPFFRLLSSFLSFPLLPSFLGLMGAPFPQRPDLETGVELAGAAGVSMADDVVASWKKIRSLRRRFHRSSSLASSIGEQGGGGVFGF